MQNLTASPVNAARLLPLLAVLAVSACASSASRDSESQPVTELKNNPVFAEPLDKNDPKITPRDLATVVFIRPGTANGNDLPVNVYINGRFLSSLLPGGYVTHNHCAGGVTVAAVFDDARIRHLGQRGHEASVNVEAGKTYYFQVEANGGAEKQARISPLPLNQVFLGEYRRQSHVLTRAPNCGSMPAADTPIAPVAAVAPVAATAPVVAVAPAKTNALATEPVAAPLEGWRAAWERGDYEAYKSFYAPEFKGELKSRKAWEAQRRTRLNNSAKKIAVDDLAVSSDTNSVTTNFVQNYSSKEFNDKGKKRLVWKPYGNDLKIVEETFVGR